MDQELLKKAIERAKWLMKEKGLARQLALYNAAKDFEIPMHVVASGMSKRASHPKPEPKPEPKPKQKEFEFEELVHKLKMLHEGELRTTQKIGLKRDLRNLIKEM